ncbi:GNAT family N-acetyltransferase [Roseovarius sp. EL26]|uniref:GNAT family N-acetyltransferase n=1 Tax=Roseovarius sp. EL26 TaxID=2126672 RepID=UPI000EA06E75|nr:GNAT family N-acetyltransferase [Roseovarius sp. EL26]
MNLRRYTRHDDFHALHALLHQTFAYMEGRINPPSSLHQIGVTDLRAMANKLEIWVLETGGKIEACMVLTPQKETLYLGKLAVAARSRRQGLAKRLIRHAEQRARDLNLSSLTLETRIELIENHAIFAAAGFKKTDETAHPGFDRPTSITMVNPVHNRDTPEQSHAHSKDMP